VHKLGKGKDLDTPAMLVRDNTFIGKDYLLKNVLFYQTAMI
jgi:hypothetical protein